MKSLGKSAMRVTSVLLSLLMLMTMFTIMSAQALVHVQTAYDPATKTLTVYGEGEL